MDMMNKITVGSMFAGIGGICLGFKQDGFEIVWANEINNKACQTYRLNLGSDYLIEGNIKSIDKSTIPYFDVLTAGFPCQPFSVAGIQKGFDDARGNLFFQIAEVIDRVRPRIVFLENVSNLIEHDNGRTFLIVYSSLATFGYTVRYRVLSSDEYSDIPQTRNRTYIVAFRDFEDCQRFQFPSKCEYTRDIFDIIDVHDKKDEIYYYRPESSFYEKVVDAVKRTDSIYRVYNSRIHIAKNRTCPTLTASMGTRYNGAPIIRDDFGYRRLTVKECLDFQGFPSNYCFPSDLQIRDMYTQIGNSVCVPVIRKIAHQIKQAIQ